MHFLLLGATGPSGQETLKELMARKHTLVIYARTPSKLPDSARTSPDVTVIEGALDDAAAFTTCFTLPGSLSSFDGVISTLGSMRGQPAGNPITAGYTILVRLMRRYHTPRIVLLSTVSVSSPRDHFSPVRETLVAGIKIIGYTAWTDVVATGELWQSEEAEGIKVTLARVPTLTDGAGGSLKIGFVGDGRTGWRLARKDLGVFFANEGEAAQWAGEIPLISS